MKAPQMTNGTGESGCTRIQPRSLIRQPERAHSFAHKAAGKEAEPREEGKPKTIQPRFNVRPGNRE